MLWRVRLLEFRHPVLIDDDMKLSLRRSQVAARNSVARKFINNGGSNGRGQFALGWTRTNVLSLSRQSLLNTLRHPFPLSYERPKSNENDTPALMFSQGRPLWPLTIKALYVVVEFVKHIHPKNLWRSGHNCGQRAER